MHGVPIVVRPTTVVRIFRRNGGNSSKIRPPGTQTGEVVSVERRRGMDTRVVSVYNDLKTSWTGSTK